MRDANCTLVLGAKGEGKTSKVLDLVGKQLAKQPERSFVMFHPTGVMPNVPRGMTFPNPDADNVEVLNGNEFDGNNQRVFPDGASVIDFIYNNNDADCYNRTYFIDDAFWFFNTLLDNNTLYINELCKSIMSITRRTGQEFIVGTQSLADMPRGFSMSQFMGIYLFRNGDDWERVKRDLPNMKKEDYLASKSFEKFEFLPIKFYD